MGQDGGKPLLGFAASCQNKTKMEWLFFFFKAFYFEITIDLQETEKSMPKILGAPFPGVKMSFVGKKCPWVSHEVLEEGVWGWR